MTKHPQSQFGYCVDGKVVFMPKRHPPENKPDRNKLKVDRTKKKEDRTNKKEMPSYSRFLQKTQRRQQLNYYDLRFTTQMTDLKNASKTGSVRGVFSAVRAMMCLVSKKQYATNAFEVRSLVSSLVRVLHTSDIENRTALYYAAHTGQCHLVEFILSLTVLDRAWNARSTISKCMSQSRSFGAWLVLEGFAPYFRKDFFDLCILNSLNDDVKDNFLHKKYSFDDIVRTAKAAVSPSSVHYHLTNLVVSYSDTLQDRVLPSARMTAQATKKTRRPYLNVTNDGDLFSYRPEDDDKFYEDLYWYDDEENNPGSPDVEETQYDNMGVFGPKEGVDELDIPGCHPIEEASYVDIDVYEEENKSEATQLFHVAIEDDSMGASFDVLVDANTSVGFPEEEEEHEGVWTDLGGEWETDVVRFDSFEAVSCFDLTDEKNSTTKNFITDEAGDTHQHSNDEDAGDEKCWDVVSDVGTVRSINTTSTTAFALSYRDAILKTPASQPAAAARTGRVTERHSHKLKTDKSATAGEGATHNTGEFDETFDPIHIRDGVKGGRGGRNRDMFKGNSRTPVWMRGRSHSAKKNWRGSKGNPRSRIER